MVKGWYLVVCDKLHMNIVVPRATTNITIRSHKFQHTINKLYWNPRKWLNSPQIMTKTENKTEETNGKKIITWQTCLRLYKIILKINSLNTVKGRDW